jgi:hypothetical protein
MSESERVDTNPNNPEPPVEYDQALIPEPVLTSPGYVESIYEFPDDATPDYQYRVDTAVAMQRRLEPKAGPKTRFGMVETGMQFATPAREWDGVSTRQVHRPRVVEGNYWLGRKLAIGIMVGSVAVLDGGTIVHGMERVAYAAEGHTRTQAEDVAVYTQGRTQRIDQTIASGSSVGQTSVDKTVIKHFATAVQAAELDGYAIRSIRVVGTSSDEDARYPHSIGDFNAPEAALASARASEAVGELQSAGLHVPADKLQESSHEEVIGDKTLIAELEAEAKKQGYPDLISAIESADAGDKLAPGLAKSIQQYFTGSKNRGVELTAELSSPGKISINHKTVETQVPDGSTPPHVPAPHFPWFIPVWRVRKRKLEQESRPQLDWVGIPHTVYVPQIIREKEDKAFVRIYDDGVNDDGTPKAGALWHTDKFEYLLREQDRLQDMIRVDLDDKDGKPQTMRALFVDAKPSDAASEAFQAELAWASRFRDGKLAERVETIVIYPSESAGTEHQDPSKVGLGLERQLSESILGVYNPVLKLLELVMPRDWSQEDLHELLGSFCGPTGVLKHEIGHVVDRQDETYAIREAKVKGTDRTYVIRTLNRNTEMETLVKELLPLNPNDPAVSFDVNYRVAAGDDELAPIATQATIGSVQLAHAERAQIVDRQILPRSRSLRRHRASARRRLASEEFADSFAALASDGVPFRTAHIDVPKIELRPGVLGQFTRRFLPSKRSQALVERRAGAVPGVTPLQPSYTTDVKVSRLDPRKDLVVGAQMTRARQAHSLDGRTQVIYLTEVNYAQRDTTSEEAGNV